MSPRGQPYGHSQIVSPIKSLVLLINGLTGQSNCQNSHLRLQREASDNVLSLQLRFILHLKKHFISSISCCWTLSPISQASSTDLKEFSSWGTQGKTVFLSDLCGSTWEESPGLQWVNHEATSACSFFFGWNDFHFLLFKLQYFFLLICQTNLCP